MSEVFQYTFYKYFFPNSKADPREEYFTILDDKDQYHYIARSTSPIYQHIMSGNIDYPIKITDVSLNAIFNGLPKLIHDISKTVNYRLAENSIAAMEEIEAGVFKPVAHSKYVIYDYDADPLKDPDFKSRVTIRTYIPIEHSSYEVYGSFGVVFEDPSMDGKPVKINYDTDLVKVIRFKANDENFILIKKDLFLKL